MPLEEREIETRHGKTFLVASGDPASPPLVLLHGSCSNIFAWGGDVVEYAKHFRVYAIDIPGEPGRSAPHRAPLRGPAMTEWLEEVLDELSADRVSLIGNSFGGWIALRFATAHPERVQRLALLAPGGVANARASFILRAVLVSLLGKRGAESTTRKVLEGAELPAEARSFMGLIAAHFRPRVEGLPLLTDAELARLSMPVLLVAGARDAIYPSTKVGARLQRLVPRVEVRLLESAGHVLLGLAPEIAEFLA
jgi:pimeloyl-ACP methyl ester carboxylesterase